MRAWQAFGLPLCLMALGVTVDAGATADVRGPRVFTARGIDLVGALDQVADESPEMMYIVARYGPETRGVEAAAMSRDDLVGSVIEAFGARGTVADDLWIVEGVPPAPVAPHDLALARLDPSSEVHAVYSQPVSRTENRLLLLDLLGELLHSEPVPQPSPGHYVNVFRLVAPGDPSYGELLGRLLHRMIHPGVWAYSLDASGRLVVENGLLLWRRPNVKDSVVGAVPEDLEQYVASPPPETSQWPLGVPGWQFSPLMHLPVDLSMEGPFREVLSALTDAVGAEVTFETTPEHGDARVAIRVADLPLGMVLIGLSSAVGAPVGDLAEADRYVFGAGPVCHDALFRAAAPRYRIRHYATVPIDVGLILSRLHGAQRDALSRDGLPIDSMAVAAREVLLRSRSGSLSSDADTLLAHGEGPFLVAYSVAANGDVKAKCMVGTYLGAMSMLELAGLGSVAEVMRTRAMAPDALWDLEKAALERFRGTGATGSTRGGLGVPIIGYGDRNTPQDPGPYSWGELVPLAGPVGANERR